MSIRKNIQMINEDISKFAEESQRSASDVKLIAVTKLHSPEEINEAIKCGVTDIGENTRLNLLKKSTKERDNMAL